MRTLTVLALVLASLAACLPRQAVADVMEAIRDAGAPAGIPVGRRGALEQEAPRLPGLCAMKIEPGDGDGDGAQEESPESQADWALPGGQPGKISRPGAAVVRRAEHSSESLKDRLFVCRC